MNNILSKIFDYKKNHVNSQMSLIPLNDLFSKIDKLEEVKKFKSKIDYNYENKKISIIAEIKKASPSKGIIQKNFHPLETAKMYEKGNATCLSILTDIKYFLGSDEILKKIKKHSKLPILRKDFIISEYQIYETRAIGADCILLIHSILEIDVLKRFVKISLSLGLDVLIEVHNQKELSNVLDIKDVMLGINNRNLNNMTVNINHSLSLLNMIPNGYNVICESGINSIEKIESLKKKGFLSFLIGEFLMKDKRPDMLLNDIFKLNNLI